MMYHLFHTYKNESSRRSHPASERLGEGTKSQGSRWHAARQELPIGRETDAVTASMAKTAWNTFDATKGQVLADREIF